MKKKLSVPDAAQLLDWLAIAEDVLAKAQYVLTFVKQFLAGKSASRKALPPWFAKLLPIVLQILSLLGEK